MSMDAQFPELSRARSLASRTDLLKAEVLEKVRTGSREFPILAFVLGPDDRSLPTVGLFGGIHGLERVGSQIILSYLESISEQLRWDRSARRLFEEVRLVAIPIVNPGGMFLNRRSNAAGVDLMRNAPVDAEEKPPFALGGHRISALLPWYRGIADAPMEKEAQALVDFVRREVFPSRFAITLDCHSGFGFQDQLWHPYAKTATPFPGLLKAQAFQKLLDRTLPNHIYKVERQYYRTHGDLWDYLYDEHVRELGSPARAFVPWTLEMGSWIWVRKNPWQLFSLQGPFNPVKPHRYRRTMRRHQPFLEFLIKAALNHEEWVEA